MHDWRRRPPLRLTNRKLGICWCWICCEHLTCGHVAAIAIRAWVIRWGPVGWRDMLRRSARCSRCGHRNVKLQHPSWGGAEIGWAAMPIDQMAPAAVD